MQFADAGAGSSLARLRGDVLTDRLRQGLGVIRLTGGLSVEQAVAVYSRLPGVLYAEPNGIARATVSAPNDPSFASQWNLARVRAVEGWTAYPGVYASGGGPTIAVLDTGVQASHPDLDQNVLSGVTCLTGSCVAGSEDDNGHGTHVAGIAAAETNNAAGVAGVSYRSRLLPVKVLGADATGSYAAIIAGIDWSVSAGARVINLSLSGTTSSTALCAATSRAQAAGVVVVAAAGNNGSSVANYPAACSGVIGVAATDSNDRYGAYSAYGSANVFLAAPGSGVLSTFIGSGYATYTGTSMASPHVAGLAALLLGQAPGRTVATVKTILATTSDKIGGGSYGADPRGTCSGCTWSADYGYGRINLARALAGGSSPPPPPAPPPPTPPPPPHTASTHTASAADAASAPHRREA